MNLFVGFCQTNINITRRLYIINKNLTSPGFAIVIFIIIIIGGLLIIYIRKIASNVNF